MKNLFQFSVGAALVLAMLLSSCSKKELPETPVKKPTAKQERRGGGDGEYDLLGHGYDVTGQYANASAAGFAVLDIPRIKAEKPSLLLVENVRSQGFVEEYGVDAEQYVRVITQKVDAGGLIKFFAGTLKKHFESSEVNDEKYIYGSYSLAIRQKRIRLNVIIDTLIKYLTPDFKTAIQSASPDQLISNYGTHFLSHIYTGAKLEIAYQSETRNSDRRTAARSGIKAGVKDVFGLDINNDVDQVNARQNFSKKLSYFTRGGDPTLSLRGEINLDGGSPVISTSNWQNSATAANAVLIDISSNGVIPIYDLITDPGRKAVVKSYIDKYIADSQIKLFYRRIPIYIYRSDRNFSHYYTPVNTPVLSGDGYSFRQIGLAFYAYNKQVPGSVPIYVYLGNNDFLYSTINQPSMNGYVRQGDIFYALTGPDIPGAIPIVGYLTSANTHYLTTDNLPQFTLYGFVFNREGFAFYGFNSER